MTFDLKPLAAIVALLAAPVLAEPAIGDSLPAGFAPKDQAGTVRRLDSLSGPNGLVLLFARSAKWCPYCQVQMKELVSATGLLAAKGYGLAVLTYDAPEVLANFASRQGIPYPLLSDEGSQAIAALGIRDPAYPAGHFAHGVPWPTVLVVDPKGRILATDISKDYRKRPSTAEVIAMAPKR